HVAVLRRLDAQLAVALLVGRAVAPEDVYGVGVPLIDGGLDGVAVAGGEQLARALLPALGECRLVAVVDGRPGGERYQAAPEASQAADGVRPRREHLLRTGLDPIVAERLLEEIHLVAPALDRALGLVGDGIRVL